MITKNQIKLVKSLRNKKNRIKTGYFIAEGEKIVDELIKSKIELAFAFSTSKKYMILDKFFQINDNQLSMISNLKKPNKVLGIFKIPEITKVDFNSNIVALEEINDPGNLGTIIRLCDWFGIKNIICSNGSVDCYNPKVVQGSMGSISRVNISYLDFDKLFLKHDYDVVASHLDGVKLENYNFKSNQIILFGNESKGLCKKLLSKLTKKLTIGRLNNNLESLNVATSVAIVLNGLMNGVTEK